MFIGLVVVFIGLVRVFIGTLLIELVQCECVDCFLLICFLLSLRVYWFGWCVYWFALDCTCPT